MQLLGFALSRSGLVRWNGSSSMKVEHSDDSPTVTETSELTLSLSSSVISVERASSALSFDVEGRRTSRRICDISWWCYSSMMEARRCDLREDECGTRGCSCWVLQPDRATVTS